VRGVGLWIMLVLKICGMEWDGMEWEYIYPGLEYNNVLVSYGVFGVVV
jgi:hypothetical protein